MTDILCPECLAPLRLVRSNKNRSKHYECIGSKCPVIEVERFYVKRERPIGGTNFAMNATESYLEAVFEVTKREASSRNGDRK